MNLPSQIEEKEKTLTELMARIFNEPLRPLAESLQQTGTEIKGLKATLKGLSESMDDTCEEVENGNDALRELKQLLSGLRNHDMASMKDGLTEIQTAHNQVDAELKALAARLAGTEERFNELTRIAQQGQESMREHYLALQAKQRADSHTMVDAFARHTSYCETANKATLAAFSQSTADQVARLKALQSTVDDVGYETGQLRQHALEESEKSRKDMTDHADKHAVLEASLRDAEKSLRSLTMLMYIMLVFLAVLIGCQLWALIRA
ncbi:hypothetical protein EYC51_06775 [Alcaligenes faecalis]|nr:hypothetical protein EYC51_06775 [Alcaligenes faecalis]